MFKGAIMSRFTEYNGWESENVITINSSEDYSRCAYKLVIVRKDILYKLNKKIFCKHDNLYRHIKLLLLSFLPIYLTKNVPFSSRFKYQITHFKLSKTFM